MEVAPKMIYASEKTFLSALRVKPSTSQTYGEKTHPGLNLFCGSDGWLNGHKNACVRGSL